MKKLVECSEEGLEGLMGKMVTFFCANYIYAGELIGVNDTCVLLKNPCIVYETGPFNEKGWKDAQPLPKELYIMVGAIESFGEVK